MRATWPSFLPLLEEEALADANVPYDVWLGAAAGGRTPDAAWLLDRYEPPAVLAAGARGALGRAGHLRRVGPRELARLAHAHAPAGPGALPSREAAPGPPRRLARTRLRGAAARDPPPLAEGGRARVRHGPRGDRRAIPRVLHVHVCRPVLGSRRAPGTRRRDLSPRRRARAPAAAALGVWRVRREERRAGRLHRGPRVSSSGSRSASTSTTRSGKGSRRGSTRR